MAGNDKDLGEQGTGERVPKSSDELRRGRPEEDMGTHGGPRGQGNVQDRKAPDEKADDTSQDGRP